MKYLSPYKVDNVDQTFKILSQSEGVIIFGTGKQTRDFIHAHAKEVKNLDV